MTEPLQAGARDGSDASSTLGDALDRAAARWPDQEAFVCDGIRLTYRDLAEATRRTAAALLARGVRSGDRVAVCMDGCAAWLTLFHACAMIGAVTVPVDCTGTAPAELAARLARSGSVLVVALDRLCDGTDVAGMLRAVEPAIEHALPGPALPQLRVAVVLGYDVPAGAISYGVFQGQAGAGTTVDRVTVARAAATVRAGDPVLLTGEARTTISHAALQSAAAAVARRIDPRPGDRCFSLRPLCDPAGVALSIVMALGAGACLLTMPRFEPAEALRILESERCTLISADATALRALSADPAFDPARLWLREGWGDDGPALRIELAAGDPALG